MLFQKNPEYFTEDYKLMIAGNSDFANYTLLKKSVDRLIATKSVSGDIIIVSGADKGAEMMGERYAAEHGFEVAEFLASNNESKDTGILRHQIMTDFADACICFWDGKSQRIKRFIDLAAALEIVLTIVKY